MLKTEQIRRVVCGMYQTNAYLVTPEGSDAAFLVDPGDGLTKLRTAIAQSGRRLEAILLTHGHFDHMLAAQPLAEETGAKVYIAAEDIELLEDAQKCCYNAAVSELPPPTDLDVTAFGTSLKICGVTLQVLKTPGHTKGSVCLYEPEGKILFSGDTMFRMSYGRTDFYGGSDREMIASLKRLLTMDDDVLVLPGHESETTIGRERWTYR